MHGVAKALELLKSVDLGIFVEYSVINDMQPELHPDHKVGLTAWVGEAPQVLILGTLAGDTSITVRAFYDDNRNAFWRIMHEVLPNEPGASFSSRKEYITSKGIALWDCLESAVRKGSSDSGFVRGTEKPNDIQGFLEAYPSIHTIILNGTSTTRKLFNKFCPIRQNVRVVPLPSTVSMVAFNKRVEAWRVLRDILK